MNKKKLNIILVPGVIVIWAFIILRIFSYSKAPIDNQIGFSSNAVPIDSLGGKDTILINANYRDPFKPSSLLLSSSSVALRELKPVLKEINNVISWPNIEYGGLVKNSRESKPLALVIISNKTIIAQENNLTSGVQILAIYPDSITVKYLKEIRTIKKK